MKIPSHIKACITVRKNSDVVFLRTDRELTEWLDKNGISVDPCDIHGGTAFWRRTSCFTTAAPKPGL